MPNWCKNVLHLSHTDPAMMTRAVEAFKKGELLQELIPCPQDLLDTTAGSFGDPVKQAELEAKQVANVEKYGYADWYVWNIAHWGTKWDVGGSPDSVEVHDALNATMRFDSAWSPPVDAYSKMENMGFTIEAFYYEPGMQFAGIYEDGNDLFFEAWGDAESARRILPRDLDEMFNISENQEMWEEEEDEDEDSIETREFTDDVEGNEAT